jgi:osmotically-inducible protein OsmY
MRPQETREKNPYHHRPEDRRAEPPWENREGDELGYQKTYGEYSSNARGWVDRPHPRAATHREAYSETYPDYSGVGPKNYLRPDENILDHVVELLTWSPDVDASDITIAVKDGIVILAGTVPDRWMIYRVDELMEEVHGVKNFDNHLKLAKNI